MRQHNSQRFAPHREKVRCITFDLDDTLWECQPVIRRAEETFYRWLQQHHSSITDRYEYSALIESRIDYMQANQQHAFDLTRLRKNWLRQLARECGVDVAMVDEGFQVFWEARNQVELFEGVRETLSSLKPHFVLGSITNGNADIHKVGLGQCFDFSVTSAEAGAAKPEQKIFELAADKAGTSLENLLHVGDDSDRDVIGALRCGAMAAWVTPEDVSEWAHTKMPHLVVSHVAELPEYLLSGTDAIR